MTLCDVIIDLIPIFLNRGILILPQSKSVQNLSRLTGKTKELQGVGVGIGAPPPPKCYIC